MITFIDVHKHEFGVEPVCRTLQIAPSSYYAAKVRPPSARSASDAARTVEVERVHRTNYGVYGARKVHAQLRREGHQMARCTVERLMRATGLQGVSKRKGPKTTVPGPVGDRPADHRDRPGPALGCQHHLHPHVLRLGVRSVCHGRVLPPHRGLAAVE